MIKINNLCLQAIKLINRVYKTYPNAEPLEYWVKRCDEGTALIYTQEKEDKVVSAGIMEICQGGIYFQTIGGVDGEWDIQEVFEFLRTVCLHFKKPLARITGRRGWKRRLHPLGFKDVGSFICTSGKLAYIYERSFKLEE